MKPRVAFFDFASCEGCQLQVINLEEKLIDLVNVVDVVSFREAMKEHSDDYDIAFIEGSVKRPMDEKRLRKIRERAKILVAYGACACTGGVNALDSQFSSDNIKRMVYGNADIANNPYFDTFPAKAVGEVVKVDYFLHGCPVDRNELVRFVTSLVMGKKPEVINYPVCIECKKKENICVFELGKFCLGPVTRAGCDALCPSYRAECEACRGLLDDPSTNSELEILQKYGLKLDDALDRFKIFCCKSGVSK